LKEVRLLFDIMDFEGEETPEVRADKDLLSHLIYNLIENAIKYSPVGQSVHIKVANGEKIKLSVQDRGPGIAAGERERVFERFYRIEKTQSSGVGLGLAIAQKIATQHGTQISIESELGKGSTFSVELQKS
jgi:signal transduction histidine kinase